jgi:hypothetical protein
MTAPAPHDRLAESIQQAFDSCWPPPPRSGGASFDFGSDEEERLKYELRLIARADFVLPFATAGLIDERARVGRLPAPADIRRDVRDERLADRYLSAGCRLAQFDGDVDPLLREELEREWSTWLSYCMRAHSPELRGTLPVLDEALIAIGALLNAPTRRIERLGPDGERLVSDVPRRPEDPAEAVRLDALLDQCEIVAAHADSFRILDQLVPQLAATVMIGHPYDSADHQVAYPFTAYLWPFTPASFELVGEICRVIQRLAESLDIDEEGEAREIRAGAYLR